MLQSRQLTFLKKLHLDLDKDIDTGKVPSYM